MAEEKTIEGLMDLENKKLAVLLLNYDSQLSSLKKDMVKSLNLLDEIAEGKSVQKKQLRKVILDNFNDLPRKTDDLLQEITEIIKEE